MATAPRMVGESCRINVLTPDPVYDHEFCEGLLRWSYRDIPGMGYLIDRKSTRLNSSHT